MVAHNPLPVDYEEMRTGAVEGAAADSPVAAQRHSSGVAAIAETSESMTVADSSDENAKTKFCCHGHSAHCSASDYVKHSRRCSMEQWVEVEVKVVAAAAAPTTTLVDMLMDAERKALGFERHMLQSACGRSWMDMGEDDKETGCTSCCA